MKEKLLSIKEIIKKLDGNVLLGSDMLNNQVDNYNVATMQLRNYLGRLKDDCLVITAGDRADIILGALQAHVSKNYPKISGIQKINITNGYNINNKIDFDSEQNISA